MASLPKPLSDATPGQKLDFASVGTPEFEAEYRRQMLLIAEHDRRTRNADRLEIDWAALDSWQ